MPLEKTAGGTEVNFARAVRIARAARGLSQKELARRAGLTPSYVSRIEQGERTPRAETLDSLAIALQAPRHLIDLLAAPDNRLKGISESDAGTLGVLLLQLLVGDRAE